MSRTTGSRAARAPGKSLQSASMTSTRLWDRAASTPAPVDGRRLPQVPALAQGDPTVEDLFDFMRDAELRFTTLRMRIEERSMTARGETIATIDVALRHPGDARVTTSRAGGTVAGEYEVWISDGDLIRTYAGIHKLGTQRPVRDRPRGLDDHDFPGFAQVYEPVTALPFETLPDTFVHPAGFCQNVLATGRCVISGSDVVLGREAVLIDCDHPRTTLIAGDRPDHRISLAVDRTTGIIVRLRETIAGAVTRQAEVVDLAPDAALPPSMFEFVFPTGTTMLY